MRVSELVAATGVPLATIKYYLREGLLMPGAATSATRAEYTSEHVRRLGLIKALAGLGLPIPKIKVILGLIDEPSGSLFDSLGSALAALPPYLDVEDGATDYPRARAVLERLGQIYEPGYAAVGQLERALAAAEDVGMPMTDDRLFSYGHHIMGLARAELAPMPHDTTEGAIEYAVLGTAMYEPVIAAMRRLAHQDLAAKILAGQADAPDERQDSGDR